MPAHRAQACPRPSPQVEGLRIPAHRVVLAARCQYFETMFSSGMRESTQGCVNIDGVGADVFMALLDHLYTDSTEVHAEDGAALISP
jgi:hypothetical protein